MTRMPCQACKGQKGWWKYEDEEPEFVQCAGCNGSGSIPKSDLARHLEEDVIRNHDLSDVPQRSKI